MAARKQDIPATDPNEKALDGTTGGALDPENTSNTDGEGVPVVPQPNDVINRAIAKAIEDINALVDQRASINSKISAIIEDLESKGINRHAFRYTMRVLGMKESQRSGLDLSYLLCRQAADLPVQSDWIKEQDSAD